MNNRVLILCILCVVCLLPFASCAKSNIKNFDQPKGKYVNIYDIVQEAFLTDGGYNQRIAKHMSEDVFNSINYNGYPPHSKPSKVDFSLKEMSQTKEDDLIYVDMIYSITIKDANDRMVGGSWDIPIRFTVKITADNWYITNKYEKP